MRKALIIMLLAMSVATMTAKDIKTVVLTTTPQMHCENCENKIKKNIRFEKGVKLIETNIPEQTVTIQYDADKTTPEKIQDGFRKIGYETQVVKSEEKKEHAQ